MQAQTVEMEKIISESQQETGRGKSPHTRGGQALGSGDLTSVKSKSGLVTKRAKGFTYKEGP